MKVLERDILRLCSSRCGAKLLYRKLVLFCLLPYFFISVENVFAAQSQTEIGNQKNEQSKVSLIDLAHSVHGLPDGNAQADSSRNRLTSFLMNSYEKFLSFFQRRNQQQEPTTSKGVYTNPLKLDRWETSKWMKYFQENTLLDISLPSTFHSTSYRLFPASYEPIARTQNYNIDIQLSDGIRFLNLDIWTGNSELAPPANNDATIKKPVDSKWFPGVTYRLPKDIDALQSEINFDMSSNAQIPQNLFSALNVHGKEDIEMSLLRPISNFVKSNVSEIVLVGISHVNGHVMSVPSLGSIDSEFELGQYLEKYISKEAFSQFINWQISPKANGDSKDAVSGVWVPGPKAVKSQPLSIPKPCRHFLKNPSKLSNPAIEPFVEKPIFFSELENLLDLIDTYWGQLLPRHDDVFSIPEQETVSKKNGDESSKSDEKSVQPAEAKSISVPIQESIHYATEFRTWQADQGAQLLQMPLRKILEKRIRVVLFVDHPLVAWFLTTYSRHQILVFVKSDHIQQISYKSPARFIPCAQAMVAASGNSTVVEKCTLETCTSLDAISNASPTFVTFNKQENNTDLGTCNRFSDIKSFEYSKNAITQLHASCPYKDIHSDLGQWHPKKVFDDLMHNILPNIPAEFSKDGNLANQISVDDLLNVAQLQVELNEAPTADSLRVSMINQSFNTQTMQNTNGRKLIQMIFSQPPGIPPQVDPTAWVSQYTHLNLNVELNRHFATLVKGILVSKKNLGEQGKGQINSILVSKYDILHPTIPEVSQAVFSELVMLLNPETYTIRDNATSSASQPRTAPGFTIIYMKKDGPFRGAAEESYAEEPKNRGVWYVFILTIGIFCLILLCITLRSMHVQWNKSTDYAMASGEFSPTAIVIGHSLVGANGNSHGNGTNLRPLSIVH